MTNSTSLLSIVTPTRGNFPPQWREALLACRGKVEFLLVYPPGMAHAEFSDARIRTLTSPMRGEVMQRLVGLLNARGKFVLALDDDDFVHPEVAGCAEEYFTRFPSNWVLRLRAEYVAMQDTKKLTRAWDSLPPPFAAAHSFD